MRAILPTTMSRRLSKRQLRELQELETLGRPEVGGSGPQTIQEGEGESIAEAEDKDEGGEAGGGGGSLFAQVSLHAAKVAVTCR